MSRSRAVRTGFSGAFARPHLFLGELVWRWVFGITSWMLIAYGVLLFLGSIKVSDADLLGLYGIIPGQFRHSLEHIFGGTGPKLVRMIAAVVIGSALVWWMTATVGRTAVLRVATSQGTGFRSLARLNFLRLITGFATALAYVGCVLLALSATRGNGGHDVASFYYVLIPLLIFLGLVWNSLNWYFSLAPLIAVRRGAGAWRSIAEAAVVSWRRSRQFTWIGFVFGAIRFVLAFAAFYLLLASFVAAAGSPAWVYLAIFLLISGTYFFLGDFLHVARLLACLRVLDWDEEGRNRPPAPPVPVAPQPEPEIIPAM